MKCPDQDCSTMGDDACFCATLRTRPRPEIGVVLVTGATGYIGGRLVPELLVRGYKVRAMVRSPAPELAELWPGAEVVVGDALNETDLLAALEGVHTAYYLIHSMVLGQDEFAEADLQAATNFRKAAEKQKVRRVIYLGGLGSTSDSLSEHLRSRLEVAQELGRGPVPVTVLRASVIIGSGSASFEIIKHLVKNLPIIFIPRWAQNKCQPISIRDVIKYLVGVLETAATVGLLFDIGGHEVLTYESMLRVQAETLHKKRWFLPFPLSNITLYAYVASLLTPVPARITSCLMQSLVNPTICRDEAIRTHLDFKTLSYKEATLRALTREEQDRVSTRWSDAYPPAHELALKFHELKEKPAYQSAYSLRTGKEASSLFQAISKIGGKQGWLNSNWMWRLRGAMDRLLFGVGTARGRRSASRLRVNDVIDFWRVEALERDHRLLLRAEMWVPGKAWLEFFIEDEGEANRLTITAHFDTHSLLGKLYWYFFLPFHGHIFNGFLKEIEKRS